MSKQLSYRRKFIVALLAGAGSASTALIGIIGSVASRPTTRTSRFLLAQSLFSYPDSLDHHRLGSSRNGSAEA